MANQQDLVRLLTGISGTQQPVQPAPVAGSKDFAGMFGAQQAAKLSGGIQNLARGGAPSPQQNIASAIGNIDLTSAKGLRTMAQVKQIQGDPEGANALNQQAVAMEEKENNLLSSKERQGNFLKFLTARHPDLVDLASGTTPVVTPENYKTYLKAGGTKLTDDQKEHAQAVTEGYTGTLIQYMDRNVQIGGENITTEQKHLAQINKERKEDGQEPILLSTFLEKKVASKDTLTKKYAVYEQLVKDGSFAGSYLDWIQKEAEATRATVKRAEAVDAKGVRRFVDDGKPVFPEVVKKLNEDLANKQKVDSTIKKETINYLETAGMQVLSKNVEDNIITPEEAMKRAQVDPSIIPLAAEALEKSLDFGGQSRESISLLMEYNAIAFTAGTPAQILRQTQAEFGVGDESRLLSFAYGEARVRESNVLLPPGSATEMEVTRSDATQPTLSESPAVIRAYLYGKAKKNALGAAQENAKQKWLINYQGNTAGFVDYWLGVISDGTKLQAIFDKAGIPPTANYKIKKISGSKI